MKKGALTIILITVIGSIFIAAGVLIAANTPPDKVVIENEGYKRDRYGAVTLDHAKHVSDFGATCKDCHHEYEDGKNVWEEGDPVTPCADCHDPEGRSKDEPMGLRYAYHDNCNDCHNQAIKEGKKNAPKRTSCTACHEKK